MCSHGWEEQGEVDERERERYFLNKWRHWQIPLFHALILPLLSLAFFGFNVAYLMDHTSALIV